MKKTCPDCKETKPKIEFYTSSRYKDGLSTYCKACSIKRASSSRRNSPFSASQNRVRVKSWQKENRERYNARMRKYNRKKMDEKKEYMAQVCELLAHGKEYNLSAGYPIKQIKDCYRRGLSVAECYAEIV